MFTTGIADGAQPSNARAKTKSRRRALLFLFGSVGLSITALVFAFLPSKKIEVVGVPSYSASSSKNTNANAEKAFDEIPETAWIPAKTQNPRYEWILMSYSAPQVVSGMRMINGFGGERTHYRYGAKVRSARILLSDYSSYYWMLEEDSPSLQSISFEKKHEIEWIKLFIHSIYKGVREPAEEIGIAEIEVF